MTSRVRFLTSAHRKGKTDRVPVAPYMGNHGARVGGATVDAYCQSGQIMANAQIRAWDTYHQDVVVAQSDNYYIAEGFGTRVTHHPDGTPTFAAPALEDLRAVDSLPRLNPETDGRMPVYLDAIRRLKQHFGNTVAIRAPGTGPFSLSSHLLGTEVFLITLAETETDPDGETAHCLHKLMETTTRALTDFSIACLEAGADLVQAGDSLASIDMISPKMYREWAWPYEKLFFDAINPVAHKHGAASLLHVCGNMTPVLEGMRDTGADIIELDHKVKLAEARSIVGDAVCLMGNLDPVGVLLQGTSESVAQAALQAIADAGPDNFVLGSGCEVPVAAPVENLQAMIRATK